MRSFLKLCPFIILIYIIELQCIWNEHYLISTFGVLFYVASYRGDSSCKALINFPCSNNFYLERKTPLGLVTWPNYDPGLAHNKQVRHKSLLPVGRGTDASCSACIEMGLDKEQAAGFHTSRVSSVPLVLAWALLVPVVPSVDPAYAVDPSAADGVVVPLVRQVLPS